MQTFRKNTNTNKSQLRKNNLCLISSCIAKKTVQFIIEAFVELSN